MELLFLGTGAGLPSRLRNVSSLALKLLDERNETWLFDCGEATQHQILRTQLKPRKIKKIFISHLHGDHIFGLPGFLSSRSFQGGEEAVKLYGPKGIKDFVKTSLSLSQSQLAYPLHFVELGDKAGELQLDLGWKVHYRVLNHGITCYGYRVEEPSSPGHLLMDKVAAYNIPNGPLLGRLKAGETIQLEDGRVVHGRDFIGPERPGRVVTILGDTRPTESILALAQGADVLVHEATHRHADRKMANQYFHSTSVQAAQWARRAGVQTLLLNHISSRYLGQECQDMEAEARQVFANTYMMKDFDSFQVEVRPSSDDE